MLPLLLHSAVMQVPKQMRTEYQEYRSQNADMVKSSAKAMNSQHQADYFAEWDRSLWDFTEAVLWGDTIAIHRNWTWRNHSVRGLLQKGAFTKYGFMDKRRELHLSAGWRLEVWNLLERYGEFSPPEATDCDSFSTQQLLHLPRVGNLVDISWCRITSRLR